MKNRILVVDDEIQICKITQICLQQQGYEVEIANDGIEALEEIKNFMPEIIILDIVMPNMDGFQVCNIIKHNPKFKNISVIFLTGRDVKGDEKVSQEIRANRFLTKPFDFEELLQHIKQLGG